MIDRNDIFYKNTKDLREHKLLKKLEQYNITPQLAIDMGCGAGRDTKYLLKNKWKVVAIDKENTCEMLTNNLNEKEKSNFKFIQEDINKIELPKCQLINAMNVLNLSNYKKEKFMKLWDKIEKSLELNGYFVGNFFGIEDEWNNKYHKMIFFTKEEINKMFENFNIIYFQEFKGNTITGLGKNKNAHILYNS